MSKRCNGKTECSYDNSDEFGCTIFSHDDTYNAKYHPEDGNIGCQVSKAGIQIYIYFLAQKSTLREVVNIDMSRLGARFGFYRLVMKRKIDGYLPSPFKKKLISSLETRVDALSFTVCLD
jgi:hypothetical protein